MNGFYKLNNRDEFISFVESMRESFACAEDWEHYFGFELPIDDEGEELETLTEYARTHSIDEEPQSCEYPVIVYCNFENEYDRFGKVTIRVFDMIPLNNL